MYEAFYHLKMDPFKLSPDHFFCYQHSSYGKAKAAMQYALHRSEGFVMVTGQPGTGKTTLINDQLSSLSRTKFAVARIVSTQLQSDDLLRMAAISFGINPENIDKATLIHRLEEYFIGQNRSGRQNLLVVDEAQDLPKGALEELRLLTNFQSNHHPLLQIFLVGQENLRTIIRDPSLEQLRQRIVAATHLEPLEPPDTQAYIRHRLLRAGWNGNPKIKAEAFPLICRASHGVPRRINQVCSRLFLFGFVMEKTTLGADDVLAVVKELQEEMLDPFQGPEDGIGDGISAQEIALFQDLEGPALQDTPGEHIAPVEFAPEGLDENPQAQRTHDHRSDQTFRLTEVPPVRNRSESKHRDKTDKGAQGPVPAQETSRMVSAFDNDIKESSRNKQKRRLGIVASSIIVFLGAIALYLTSPARLGDKIQNLANLLVSYDGEPANTEPHIKPDIEPRSPAIGQIAEPDGNEERFNRTTGHGEDDSVFIGQALATIIDERAPSPSNPPVEPEPADTYSVEEIPSRPEPESIVPGGQKEAPTATNDVLAKLPQGQRAEGFFTATNDLDSVFEGFKRSLDGESVEIDWVEEYIIRLKLSGDATFDFDSNSIKASAYRLLDKIVTGLTAYKEIPILVVGHTDQLGPREYNFFLSRQRANAVADYFLQRGLNSERVRTEGRGDSDLITEINSRAARSLNRRVEVYLDLQQYL
jgi:type II secretory pathway predicted ATPase ExeA/outer membrane protein OmpA-like peptidoglycan-associated protein